MNFVDYIFFFYIFIGFYMLSLMVLIYLQNKNELFKFPNGNFEPVSFVLPCYNAQKTIGQVIESILGMDYPKGLIEIIVVDDMSSDNSKEVIEKYVKKYNNIRLIVNSRNSGGAAEPTNLGILAAKYSYVAVVDDDSYPAKGSLKKMIGFLQNEENVAAVTCAVLSKHPETFMQKLQSIEYTIIAWTRKLLDCIDSVYVTPGPLALYKKDKLIEVGLFDTKNLTQDIEIVWRLLSKGYKARMCLAASVYSETPRNLKSWWRQRIRWTIGGNQTLWKYKQFVFRKGMLGTFIIPFFAFSLFLGLLGIIIFLYLISRRFIISYLLTKYSIYAGVTLIGLQDISFNPSVLNYFGIILLILGAMFTFFGLSFMKELKMGKDNLFNIFFYQIVYLTLLPIVMVAALYKLGRGNYQW